MERKGAEEFLLQMFGQLEICPTQIKLWFKLYPFRDFPLPIAFLFLTTVQSLGQGAGNGLDCAFSPRAENLYLFVILALQNVKITYP